MQRKLRGAACYEICIERMAKDAVWLRPGVTTYKLPLISLGELPFIQENGEGAELLTVIAPGRGEA